MKVKKSVTLKANCFLHFLCNLLEALHQALQSINKKKVSKDSALHTYLSLTCREICNELLNPSIFIGSFQKNHLGYFRARYFFRARTFLSG